MKYDTPADTTKPTPTASERMPRPDSGWPSSSKVTRAPTSAKPTPAAARVADKERRIVRHFGMLGEKGGERRIGGKVLRARQQRRVQPQHVAYRGRILIQETAQPVACLVRSLVVGRHHVEARGRQHG